MSDRKSHWENIFRSKSPEEVSWTQEVPETSLLLIRQLKLPKTAEIIDVGGETVSWQIIFWMKDIPI